MITVINNENKSIDMNYKFSKEEIFLLAKFLRKNEDKIPKGLENFHKALEDTIYKTLSLEEVSKLYT